MDNTIILLFLGIVIFEILALYLLTEWSIHNKPYTFILGVLAYILVAIQFAYIMKLAKNKLALINALWQIINLIFITLLGVYLYKEKLSSCQYVAIVLAIIAVILLLIS